MQLAGGLYIVATPIGNLGDITLRAIETLKAVSAIACEDTRVTHRLLDHLGIRNKLIRYDDHASEKAADEILSLALSHPVALVSDAGTPLISDPGYRLIRKARAMGIAVTSIPGPSAVITALTISGMPTDRFLFAGFLPAKAIQREKTLQELSAIPATLVFYETAPRLLASLEAIGTVLSGREIAVARELTKLFEECRTGLSDELIAYYTAHPAKGEIVLMVKSPAKGPVVSSVEEADDLLRAELACKKPSQAAAHVARVTGLDRKALYLRAMELK